MSVFIIVFVAFVIGIVLIFFLKSTSPPPPHEKLEYVSQLDKPTYLTDREAFKTKCIDFLSKFNLQYRHSVWADDHELEIDLQDETPVVGGKYLALCIFEPLHENVTSITVQGFLETVKGEGAARGIIITTGYFDQESSKVIEEHPVELVDALAFIKYLKKLDIY